MKKLLKFDAKFLLRIQKRLHNRYLDSFFKVFTHLGDFGAIWIFLIFIFLTMARTRKMAVFTILTLFLTWIINTVVLKKFLKRKRPYESLDEVRLLIKPQRDFSFPSGHAASSFACALSIILVYPSPIAVFALIIAFLMSFSRVYVGVHYPLDVTVGSLIGILISLGLYLSLNTFF